MYFKISLFAFIVVAFLTLRDIRIYRRTKLDSFRRGALKGMGAMTIVLIGLMIVDSYANFGMLLVFLGVFINKKGPREMVFETAGTLDRFLGKTDLKG